MITSADSLLATTMWPLIRQNLQRSGKLAPCVFIRDPKGLQIVGIHTELLGAPGGKAQIESVIRDRVAAQKATLVMLVAEAWAARVPAIESAIVKMGGVIQRASARENRREVLQVNVQQPGKNFSGLADIVRDADGKPDVGAEPPVLSPAQSSMKFFQ